MTPELLTISLIGGTIIGLGLVAHDIYKEINYYLFKNPRKK